MPLFLYISMAVLDHEVHIKSYGARMIKYSTFLTLFFQAIEYMCDRKHQRFVMHIIKNVLICQNLQTGGKVLIRFPETQGQGKKRKQCKFITYISFFIFLPPSFSQARASLFIFPSKYCPAF